MTTPVTRFDHLVVAATTLDAGVAWVQARLGVTVPFGGIHDHMGTHNCVGQLTPTTFLEIIAINPDATPDRAPIRALASVWDNSIRQRTHKT